MSWGSPGQQQQRGVPAVGSARPRCRSARSTDTSRPVARSSAGTSKSTTRSAENPGGTTPTQRTCSEMSTNFGNDMGDIFCCIERRNTSGSTIHIWHCYYIDLVVPGDLLLVHPGGLQQVRVHAGAVKDGHACRETTSGLRSIYINQIMCVRVCVSVCVRVRYARQEF